MNSMQTDELMSLFTLDSGGGGAGGDTMQQPATKRKKKVGLLSLPPCDICGYWQY